MCITWEELSYFLLFLFGLEYVWLLLTIIHESRPKPFHFGIVDEVDSVLIDEGRNPLLISGEVGLTLIFNVASCDPLYHYHPRLSYPGWQY